ncbi:MAG: hypothetical protein HKN12_09095, partial [Gemmatimonadetes bacterium]|nr:hypothetical protein [Gemmatimonadota bacterium]
MKKHRMNLHLNFRSLRSLCFLLLAVVPGLTACSASFPIDPMNPDDVRRFQEEARGKPVRVKTTDGDKAPVHGPEITAHEVRGVGPGGGTWPVSRVSSLQIRERSAGAKGGILLGTAIGGLSLAVVSGSLEPLSPPGVGFELGAILGAGVGAAIGAAVGGWVDYPMPAASPESPDGTGGRPGSVLPTGDA